jgi:hypothetical protein
VSRIAASRPQVYLILDEFICGGEIQETAKKVRGQGGSEGRCGVTARARRAGAGRRVGLAGGRRGARLRVNEALGSHGRH